MKAIDLSAAPLSLQEALELAGEDNVVLRTSEGRQYVLAEVDDFAEEVAKARQNESRTRLLDERSRETTQLTSSQVKEQLQGTKRRRPKESKK